jgi:hypothetical protein
MQQPTIKSNQFEEYQFKQETEGHLQAVWSIPPKEVPQIRAHIATIEKEHCNDALKNLQVEGKFASVASLEEDLPCGDAWMHGMVSPQGQLSFLLRAGSK